MYPTAPGQGASRELLNEALLEHMTSKVSSGYTININMTRRKGIKNLEQRSFLILFYMNLYFPHVK